MLTFPAIWPDRVKQLMIEAAELVSNLLHGLLIMKLNECNFNSFFFQVDLFYGINKVDNNTYIRSYALLLIIFLFNRNFY